MHAANGLLWWPTAPGTERDGGEGTAKSLGGCRLDASRCSSGSTVWRRARRQRQGRVFLGSAGAHVGVEDHRRPQVQRRHRAHVRLCNTTNTGTKRHRQAPPKEPPGDNPRQNARARATAEVSHSSRSTHGRGFSSKLCQPRYWATTRPGRKKGKARRGGGPSPVEHVPHATATDPRAILSRCYDSKRG